IDSGVYEGAEIGMNYDPLVAKLIASGRDRQEAIANLREALDGFVIEGIGHNIPFLAALAGHPRFAAGDLTTNFIAEEFPGGFASVVPDEAQARLLVSVGAVIHHQLGLREQRISGQLRVPLARGGAEWVVLLGDDGEYRVTVVETADGFAVIDRKASHEVASDWRAGESLFRGRIDARPVTVQIVHSGVGYRLIHGGVSILLKILSPRAAELQRLMPIKAAPDLSRFLLSPMPGLLISLAVAEGDIVKAGQELAVVEAMKMENILRATTDGRVNKVLAESGASLVVDQPILEFAP
ncbi:MAG: biotin/lipoyl-containing protein, partial [Dongiaceae bacterium]